jgi:single-strand DNA-binding protein
MNKVILIGTLTKDCELRYNANNTPICSFSIAVNEYVKGEQKTQYFNIVSFSAEKLSQYLVKGTKVAIEGKLNNSSYEKDEVKHYRTDVIANPYGGIELVGSKKQGDNSYSAPANDDVFGGNFEEDITPVNNDPDMPL